ncbi:MAG: HAD-IIA family hydrolase [Nitrososphaerota archaeon]
MSRLEGVVLDLDGCVYIGDTPIPGAREAVASLRGMGLRIVFLTNNSTLSRRRYVEKLARMGIDSDMNEILTSGTIAAQHLSRIAPRPRILAITEAGFIEEAGEYGLEIVDLDRWWEATYVVSGLDRALTYRKLSAACRAILAGATFICTNPDNIYPSDDGLDPGAGAIAAAISAATGAQPLYMGKPYPQCMKAVLELLGLEGGKVAFVGDRADTDLMLARLAGGVGILVKTGLFGLVPDEDASPDYIIESIAELPGLMERIME